MNAGFAAHARTRLVVRDDAIHRHRAGQRFEVKTRTPDDNCRAAARCDVFDRSARVANVLTCAVAFARVDKAEQVVRNACQQARRRTVSQDAAVFFVRLRIRKPQFRLLPVSCGDDLEILDWVDEALERCGSAPDRIHGGYKDWNILLACLTSDAGSGAGMTDQDNTCRSWKLRAGGYTLMSPRGERAIITDSSEARSKACSATV